jgi:hypothetical protein
MDGCHITKEKWLVGLMNEYEKTGQTQGMRCFASLSMSYIDGKSRLANPVVNLAVVSYLKQWSTLVILEKRRM